jgi:signal peptidase I
LKTKFLVAGIIGLSVLVIILLGCFASIPYISPFIRGQKFMKVGGSSMEPTIKDGATVSYEAVPFENLKIDDIIIFNKPDTNVLVIGRIIRITPEGLETKYDNNTTPNPYKITSKEYVGKIVRIDNPPF